MSFNIAGYSQPDPSKMPKSTGAPPDPVAAAAFSQALQKARAVESVPPAGFSFQSQLNPKKKRVEAIETELEKLDEEESIYKTANDLITKLKALSELERKSLGL